MVSTKGTVKTMSGPEICTEGTEGALRDPEVNTEGTDFFNKGIKLPRRPSANTFQDRGGNEKKILLSAQMRKNQCYKLFIAQNSVKGNILYMN